ncbi:hypothetical protein A7Q26_02215 [Sphingobium sp. TCM1]|nr:hypothetical protein A7Q26_02215 [Sphingobium sp. TCM1]
MARDKAQLNDFDAKGFREGLDLAVEALDANPLRTPQGKAFLMHMYSENLATRLKVADYARRHPEVRDQKIERPVFVMGMPRTGTTLASYLLGADRNRRSLLRWEVAQPVPPPTTATLYSNPVIDAMYAFDEDMEKAGRSFAAIHYEAPDGPTECTFVMAHDFKSLFVESMSAWKGYSDWYLSADLQSAYDYHRLYLQILQSQAPGCWALKLPSHALGIRTLMKMYPDARIIWTHRDPYRSLNSLMSMISKAELLSLSQSDHAHIRTTYPRQLHEHLARPMAVMAEQPTDPFYHLHYAALLRDPIGEMRALYGWLGDDFTPDVEARMRSWLANNPQGRFGRHRYDFQQFGLTRDAVTPWFEAYLKMFDIEMEG